MIDESLVKHEIVDFNLVRLQKTFSYGNPPAQDTVLMDLPGDFYVVQISCSLYGNVVGFVEIGSSKRDDVSVTIKIDGTKDMFYNSSMDINRLNELGMSQNFQPFIIKKNAAIKFQFSHTVLNMTTDTAITATVDFVGMIVKR
jgi:hypothetical protein